MKRLIVNADDFGITHGVNRAIVACHEHGIVTSATLMATGACLSEAAALSSQMPQLSVGCHVVLVDGQPLLPPNEVRSLLAPGTDRFYYSITEVLHAVARGRFRAEEVEAEASAQMAKLAGTGIALSHFDSHKHTHMFPSILRPLLRAAHAHGIAAVRNPFDAPGVVGWREACGQRTLFIRKAETALLRMALRKRWMRAVRQADFTTTDGCLGVAATGTLDASLLRAMLRRIPPGTWELVCHPGYNDSELASVRTKLRASREVEMTALLGITRDEVRNTYGVLLEPFRAHPPQAGSI
jgi:predicted glycoside hydrolase/deacetylase ChbG (UPF0249 family)